MLKRGERVMEYNIQLTPEIQAIRERFLRKPAPRKNLIIGDIAPDIVTVDGVVDLGALIQDYLIIANISTRCSACMDALEALDLYTKNNHITASV